jgi:hypothetical protein
MTVEVVLHIVHHSPDATFVEAGTGLEIGMAVTDEQFDLTHAALPGSPIGCNISFSLKIAAPMKMGCEGDHTMLSSPDPEKKGRMRCLRPEWQWDSIPLAPSEGLMAPDQKPRSPAAGPTRRRYRSPDSAVS